MDFCILPKTWATVLVYPLSKKLSVEYSQKPLEQSATDTLKSASKRAIQNIVETTGDFIGNKIAGKISKVLKTSLYNNLEKATN